MHQDSREGSPFTDPEPPKPEEPIGPQYGPLRRAPAYYVGETYGRRRIQYPDVERYPNGALPGKRDKAARRIIRGAMKRKFSSVEKSIGFTRALKAQAVEVTRDEHGDLSENAQRKRAKRLYEMELAIHTPVWVPSKKEIRAMRTQKRKDARRGKRDAIAQLVDRMTEPKQP